LYTLVHAFEANGTPREFSARVLLDGKDPCNCTRSDRFWCLKARDDYNLRRFDGVSVASWGRDSLPRLTIAIARLAHVDNGNHLGNRS